MHQDKATSEFLGCFRARQAPHNAMQNTYRSLPLEQRYRHVAGSSHPWNALLSPDSDLELFFPLEEGGNGCYLYKCTFWKADKHREIRRVQGLLPCESGTSVPLHSTNIPFKPTHSRRGRSYPKNSGPGAGNISGFQQASAPVTAPVQTKLVLS